MKIKKKYFLSGIIILAVLLISYFIKINLEEGSNYITESSVLGILIFYNPFILGIYLLIALVLIIKGLKKS